MAKNTNDSKRNVVDTKGQPLPEGEDQKSPEDKKQDGKVKRILKRAGKEALFVLVGAAIVGSIWGASARKSEQSTESENSGEGTEKVSEPEVSGSEGSSEE